MRRKEKQPLPESPPPVAPVLSQAGNPFPPGLKPVRLDCTMISPMLDEPMPRPLGKALPYRYETFGPNDADPPLKLRFAPRGDGQTRAQYEHYRRDIERSRRTFGVYLRLFQQLCTLVGNHRACPDRTCRRLRRCARRRDEDRYEVDLVVYPPCIPLDREIMETYRQEVIAELRRIVARSRDGDPPLRDADPAGSPQPVEGA